MNREQRRMIGKQSGTPAQLQASKSEFYQGSVPPPVMLKEFGNVNVSFPERIVKMAEDAGNRQLKQLENQEKQIDLEADNRKREIEASERLKTMEIKARNADLIFKNVITLLGLLFAAGVCVALLYMSYILLMADKTGSALGFASPIIGGALLAAIKLLRK